MTKKVKYIIAVGSIILIGIVVFFVMNISKTSTIMKFPIPGASMEPTFRNGEIVELRKGNKDIGRGDLIVYKKDKEYFMKRVIGIGGDTISFKNNLVSLNGKLLEEPYLKCINMDFSQTTRGGEVCDYRNVEGKTFEIPGKNFFVMGDNRNHSSDSRMTTMSRIPCEETTQAMNECSTPKPYIEEDDILGTYIGEK